MVKPSLSKGTGSAAPECGLFVWTDTWVRWNGKWQIAAAEDLIVPEESAKPLNYLTNRCVPPCTLAKSGGHRILVRPLCV